MASAGSPARSVTAGCPAAATAATAARSAAWITIAAAPALIRAVRRRIDKGQASVLARRSGSRGITVADVAGAAAQGDRVALAASAEIGGHLGLAASWLINLFGPAPLVVAGELAGVGEPLIGPTVAGRERADPALGPRVHRRPRLPARRRCRDPWRRAARPAAVPAVLPGGVPGLGDLRAAYGPGSATRTRARMRGAWLSAVRRPPGLGQRHRPHRPHRRSQHRRAAAPVPAVRARRPRRYRPARSGRRRWSR